MLVPDPISSPPSVLGVVRAQCRKEKGALHDHLLASKKRVADELASPQGNGSVGHDCGCCRLDKTEPPAARMTRSGGGWMSLSLSSILASSCASFNFVSCAKSAVGSARVR
jgi:hypothetical protein